ncbi:hypothetical protein GE061_005783 [Apolygus lucorum]|uniref:Zinc finger CCHC domain-containing protein 7 n=1 Tax=Apolygus lucorum TaxID=248454 RepID=A0A8S9X183_APOLU|nr:hypothetical protein GE061_005783 [Apolygus lucorum]
MEGRKSFDFKMMSDADRALDAVAKAMNRLELALSDKPTEPLAEQIPRSVLMEIDPWDPDEIEAVSIGTYFDIFDGITKDLADNLRVQLLRIKLRGTAKTFLLDNGHLLEGDKPYQGLRRALLRWYGRDDPEKAAERLWTIQKSAGETFRQFAERVQHTATQASRADGMLMDATQKRTWIAARSVKAFLKGLPGTYAGYFVNNPPASLEEAMKKAEQLEDALEPRSSDPWNVARIQVQDKRCFRCQELGHIASGCPNIPRPPSPPPIRRKAMGMPHKPCLFCGSMTHFPASCLKNPKNYPCEFCGLYGHKDSECRVKTRQYSDEPMCDYCGYYGHLEVECPQKTESYMQLEASKRPEPRKVLALTSTSHEPNPHQAVALRTEPKNVETPSTSTPLRPEPVPCNMEIDDLIPDDEDTYPVARFVEVQQSKESPEPEDPVKESPPDEVLPEEESQKTAVVAHRQLRRLPKKDYQQLHSGRPSKQPKPETKERRGAVMSKDLRAMIKDVERRLDEEESRDRSPDAEPPVEPQLPPPRALPPRTRTRPKDLDKEWTVLETGAEMMYGAANENELEEGWHRHASAMRVLQENIRGTQPRENPRVDAAEIARAVAQQLQQPQVNIPTSADIAREVVALMNEQLPPTQDPQQWADRIAELIVQKQSPAYSPIHDSGAIARAILIELRQHVSWQLHDAEQDASAPATSHENLAASAPTTSHEHLAASAPSTSRESLPASVSSMPREELVATAPTTSRSELPQAEGTMYESQSEEEDRPVAERRCIACGRTRDHNSRLWCEACRAFLRRAKKAAIDGRPITCKDPRHRQNPDNAACRGCRAKHLQTLEAATTQPTDGRCAAEDIGFQRGGGV